MKICVSIDKKASASRVIRHPDPIPGHIPLETRSQYVCSLKLQQTLIRPWLKWNQMITYVKRIREKLVLVVGPRGRFYV